MSCYGCKLLLSLDFWRSVYPLENPELLRLTHDLRRESPHTWGQSELSCLKFPQRGQRSLLIAGTCRDSLPVLAPKQPRRDSVNLLLSLPVTGHGTYQDFSTKLVYSVWFGKTVRTYWVRLLLLLSRLLSMSPLESVVVRQESSCALPALFGIHLCHSFAAAVCPKER